MCQGLEARDTCGWDTEEEGAGEGIEEAGGRDAAQLANPTRSRP